MQLSPKGKVVEAVIGGAVVIIAVMIGGFVLFNFSVVTPVHPTLDEKYCLDHGYVNSTGTYFEEDALGGYTLSTKCIDKFGVVSPYFPVIDRPPDWTRFELIAIIALALGVAVSIGVITGKLPDKAGSP